MDEFDRGLASGELILVDSKLSISSFIGNISYLVADLHPLTLPDSSIYGENEVGVMIY